MEKKLKIKNVGKKLFCQALFLEILYFEDEYYKYGREIVIKHGVETLFDMPNN
jgi:hypothetical protein